MSEHGLDRRGGVRDWLIAGPWREDVDLSALLSADGSPWGQDGRWVLTKGRRAVDGSFAEFADRLGEPIFTDDGVDYRNLSLHWDLPFTVDGRPVVPEPYQLDNPVCQVPFDAPEMRIGSHVIDLRTGRAVG